MAQSKESAKSTREKAAEARAAAQAAERRRERMIRIIGGIAVLAVVIGILAIGVMNSNKNETAVDGNAKLPPGVSSDTEYGFVVNPDADAPSVEIYEDPQCPACANFEVKFGPTVQQLAADNDIKLSYHPMVFLDTNLRTDHSVRATGAWGCAVEAGVGEQFHSILFASQPANEGDGWTDEQLKQFGEAAGLSGQAQDDYVACVDAGNYQGWGPLSNQAAADRGVASTPSIYVDGKEVPSTALANEKALREALTNPAQ